MLGGCLDREKDGTAGKGGEVEREGGRERGREGPPFFSLGLSNLTEEHNQRTEGSSVATSRKTPSVQGGEGRGGEWSGGEGKRKKLTAVHDTLPTSHEGPFWSEPSERGVGWRGESGQRKREFHKAGGRGG
eukprot:Sspe_Gene.74008::Locus_45322_Transcript_1_1_Confidence_1.000_Length_577::g.74008::m.74008